MKHALRSKLIFFGALLLFASYAPAQSPSLHYRELILQVPGIAGKRGFPEIRGKLINIPGVHVVAFCESQYLIMLKIEKKKVPDNKPVFESIKELGYKFFVKEEATITKAMNACRDKAMTVYHYDDPTGE